VHGSHRARRSWADPALLIVLLALAGWTLWVSNGGRAQPGPAIGLIGLVAGAYVAGRLASQIPAAVGTVSVVLAAGIGLAVLSTPGALSGAPLAPPLGYGNANGALYALGAGAALVAGLSCGRPVVRLLAVLAAVGFTGLAVLTGSQAGAAVAAGLVVLGAALALRPTLGRPVPALAALAVVLALVSTVALGLAPSGGPAGAESALEGALSSRRVTLWAESLDLLDSAPIRGVGAGRFQDESPTARADDDARWAHSLWLQQAAETGLPGLVLLLTAAGIVVLRVRADGPDDGGVPAMGTAVVAGLLVHASIDYVVHFPVLPTFAALLAGLTAVSAGSGTVGTGKPAFTPPSP
jgi:O-antigen ligase